MTVKDGKYGPYVTHGGVNATLPKGMAPDAVTLEQAIELLRAREASGGGKPARKPAAKAAKKAPAKKAAAKKAAPKKQARAAE